MARQGTLQRFVTYVRVSTKRQGASGLGLEAQAAAVAGHVAGLPGAEIVGRYVEVESGKRDDRPELDAAMADCRCLKATLLIAKLDRLSRDLAFIAKLMKGGVEIVACDMPAANKTMLQMMAVFAEHERDMVSSRTKAALAAAKARGVRLGEDAHGALRRWRAAGGVPRPDMVLDAQVAAEELRGFVEERVGLSLRGLAAALDEAGLKPRGGAERWNAEAVRQLRKRLGR